MSPSDALDFNDLKRISSEAAIEGFVAAEILKSQVDRGECRELYFFRDQQGLEVDFLIPRPNAGLWPVEAKASKTVTPAMAASLLSLQRALGARAKRLIVAHRKFNSSVQTVAVARGVEALDISQLVADRAEVNAGSTVGATEFQNRDLPLDCAVCLSQVRRDNLELCQFFRLGKLAETIPVRAAAGKSTSIVA